MHPPLHATLLLACAAVAVGLPRAAHGADVHVSPAGDDAASGAVAAPVASLRRSLDRVREIRTAEPGRSTPVVVELADGRHELAAPLVVVPEDSGTEPSPTVIRAAAGARPVVSGGRIVRGWSVADVDGRPRWTVHLLDAKAGEWRFAQLFVDDQRRFRPVLPAAGCDRPRRPDPPGGHRRLDRQRRPLHRGALRHPRHRRPRLRRLGPLHRRGLERDRDAGESRLPHDVGRLSPALRPRQRDREQRVRTGPRPAAPAEPGRAARELPVRTEHRVVDGRRAARAG